MAYVPDDRPELVIFDCDGVLVDSEPISNRVLAHALTAAGLPTTATEALGEYKGRIMSDVVDRAQRALGRSLPDDFVPSYEADRIDAFREDLQPMPGAAEAVRAVRAAGVAVCVASQGKLEKIELTLTLTGLRELFGANALFSAYSVARGKPHPDLFLYAAEQTGVGPASCVVIEDTAIGVTAAVAAGMRVLALAPPGTTDTDTEALRAAGAELIRGLTEVASALGLVAVHPTAVRVGERLRARGLDIAVQMAPASTRTAADAAAALGVEVGQIVKSLVFLREGDDAGQRETGGDIEPVLVLCAGDRRVAADRLGLRPASADQARAATGFAIGGIPPLGHDRELPTLIDESLRRFDTLWCAAGTPQAVFAIDVEQLLAALPDATVGTVAA